MGISHIIDSSTHVEAEVAKWAKSNYRVKFHENILNHPSKKPYLFNYQADHEILYLDSNEKSFAIEVIRHSDRLSSLSSPWRIEANRLILKSNNVDLELSFFEGLGFKRENNLLKIISPVEKWRCEIEVVSSDETSNYFLDSSGITCVSFISSDITKDLAKVKNACGSEILDPFELVINQQLITASLFRSPTNAICEFIQIGRK